MFVRARLARICVSISIRMRVSLGVIENNTKYAEICRHARAPNNRQAAAIGYLCIGIERSNRLTRLKLISQIPSRPQLAIWVKCHSTRHTLRRISGRTRYGMCGTRWQRHGTGLTHLCSHAAPTLSKPVCREHYSILSTCNAHAFVFVRCLCYR